MTGRFNVWRHDCINDGCGDDPCDPVCDDPWQVDTPPGLYWTQRPGDGFKTTFATHAEAINLAQREAITREHVMICPTQSKGED